MVHVQTQGFSSSCWIKYSNPAFLDKLYAPCLWSLAFRLVNRDLLWRQGPVGGFPINSLTRIIIKIKTTFIYPQFLAHKIRNKVKFLNSPNQICRYSPKESINQALDLLDGWFSQVGTLKQFFGYRDFKFSRIL